MLVFRANTYRLIGFPSVAFVFLAYALFKWQFQEDVYLLRACPLIIPAALLVYFYFRAFLLKISADGIEIHEPLNGTRYMAWDDVVHVRRSSAPPGRRFFIDLIASSGHSLFFNPFFYERSSEIIELLNEHLDSDFFESDSLPVDAPIAELTAVAEPGNADNRSWMVFAVIALFLLLVYFFMVR